MPARIRQRQAAAGGGSPLFWVAIVFAALIWSGVVSVPGLEHIIRPIGPKPSPVVPGPSLPKPSAELIAATAPITAKLTGSPTKAEALAQFYLGLADVIERDDGAKLKTSTQFRNSHAIGLEALTRKTRLAEEPRVGAEIDSVLAGAIGLDPGELDAAERRRLVESLQAIAWACEMSRGL